MNVLKDFLMQRLAKFFGLASGVLVVTGALLASCAPDTTAPTLQSRPTDISPTDVALVPTTVSDIMTSVPPFTDTACLDCHTDQPTLVDLAKPHDDAHEALSSGPG
jgi:hypothetical protein